MNFREYQLRAVETRRQPVENTKPEVVPLLGLAGESGELLSEYKKYLRDGRAHSHFQERVSEELGDLLWYISDLANWFELDLSEIASANLSKCKNRWSDTSVPSSPRFFDDDFPEHERLPRKMIVDMSMVDVNGRSKMRLMVNGEQKGDPLTDNAHIEDGYRFHDILHFGFASVLSWSPVLRKILNVKRHSDLKTDEAEDGARARVTEEGMSAIIFRYAEQHAFLDGVRAIDSGILRMLKMSCEGLEVSKRTPAEWERAIRMAFDIWREINSRNGGRFIADLEQRYIGFVEWGAQFQVNQI